MAHSPSAHRDLGESAGQLLSLGLTQLSIQVTLSTSLTASALGLAALATALTSTILTVQDAGYTLIGMSESTQSTHAPVHEPVKAGDGKTPASELAYKQAIVPGGIPVVPKWLMKLLHLA